MIKRKVSIIQKNFKNGHEILIQEGDKEKGQKKLAPDDTHNFSPKNNLKKNFVNLE